ncbi:D-cysteine desulfhydrase family protein [Tepidimicrobium xylanilyticum]|uniref:D-cysteine desulfhydrase family protein n=1 Tax=Tepidimicrobium xylanilyticum TaxID=1123352 RepID=UPI00264D17D7|nr:D-cysteine desulfhydrase family protein [Tepidimicrobium xylanilyticum]GMG98035.1 putative 1-aminocyclopropane-1-carboxylate deaminase [Tepidimicrobium xylanilyticum]
MVNRIRFANLPTRIERLNRLSKELGRNIYIKRDDETGMEISGNKIRKLEFSVGEALENNCDYLITCGGIQSNHARATAAVAAKLGLGSYLVLKGDENEEAEGNLFLDKLLGAKIKFITKEEYKYNRKEIMEDIRKSLEVEGHKAYIIPEGASNGMGSLGYVNAMEEILEQEKQIDVKFDAIVVTVGSGGTYAGLYYGNHVNDNPATIYGFNICDTKEHFQQIVLKLLDEIAIYTGKGIDVNEDELHIIDGYPGLGYALSRSEEIEFINYIAKLEGIILDPVYTGKAMYGLVEEIKKGTFDKHENILFIHTGGIFGWNREQRGLLK